MTHYSTCNNCSAVRSLCARYQQVRAAIKGAGITSLKFRCEYRQPLFHPGQRVSVTWPVDADGDGYPSNETWPATVITETGNRFVIVVDDVKSDLGTPARDYIKRPDLFAKVVISRLKPLNEVDRAICQWCGDAPVPGASPESCKSRSDLIWESESNFLPPSCPLSRRGSA